MQWHCGGCGEIWWVLGNVAKMRRFVQKISMLPTSIDRISTLRWSYIENSGFFQCVSISFHLQSIRVLQHAKQKIYHQCGTFLSILPNLPWNQCRVLWMSSQPSSRYCFLKNNGFRATTFQLRTSCPLKAL